MLSTPAHDIFIAPATRYPAIWRIFIACLTGFLVYLIGAMTLFYFLAEPLLGITPTLQTMERVFAGVAIGDTPDKMALLLATFIPMALAAMAMAAWHWRGPATLFGPLPHFWGNFVKAALVIVVLNACFFLYSFLTESEPLTRNLETSIWAKALLWAIPLLFVQITAEEMVFRGYFQQQLAARFASPFIWLILPSLLFGLGHFDPEIDPKLAYMIIAATTIFGIIAADLTRITGNLGAAMGLHFANNFFALLLVGIPGQLSGVALFHAPFTMDQTEVLLPYVIVDLLILLAVWFIARRVVGRLQSAPAEII